MTRLFVLIYAGVLAALFAAWYIHGKISIQRGLAERSRVFENAHGGGARLVARRIDAAPAESRDQVFRDLGGQFDYPISLIPLDQLPSSVQRRIARGDDVVHFFPEGSREVVVAVLASGTEVVRLGPFPNYELQAIEESIRGWMRLAADELGSVAPDQRQTVLEHLQQQFEFPIEVMRRGDLPSSPLKRLSDGADAVFFAQDADSRDGWFAAAPLAEGAEVVLCGPFPNFERIEQQAAATTLALVLLPTAVVIALMLRPVARQLRHVERAAKTIAAGNLSARVDERRVRAAKSLAQSFNNMASRTETLVRTQRELLQAVSHELRTPLSRMRFAIDLVETARSDAERKERLDSLDAATVDLDELIGELLSYVRMEMAESPLNREHVNVHNALEVLIPKYAALHPSIEFCVNDQIHEHEINVFADCHAVQRVLGNLLSNAGRCAKTKVTITATSNDATTTIDVDDDGTGIPESDRDRVFEPFVQLDDRTKRSSGGVGLGLALVKRIVTQQGGTVEVLTSPLGGCRIRTVWPRNESALENR